MDSKPKEDPFDLNIKKKLMIQDFLVLKKPEIDQDNYIIKKFEKSRTQNLEILNIIKEILETYPNLTDKQKIDYCKNQRTLIKLYLKNLQHNKNEKEESF